MSPAGNSFFDQFLDDYFAESEEHLSAARNMILAIESAAPDTGVDSNALDELLRNFHSLKGLSAMVGLEEATQLAHYIEDYLKQLKRPDAVISRDGTESVLAGLAAFERVLEAKRRSAPYPDISQTLLQLEAATEEARARTSAARKIEGGVWRFVFKPSVELASQGVTVNTIRDRLRSIGEIVRTSPLVENEGEIAFEFLAIIRSPQPAFESLRSWGVEISKPEERFGPAPSGEETGSGAEAPQVTVRNLVRVEMDRLDQLMQIAGELVISRFRLDEVLRKSAHAPGDWAAVEAINTGMGRQLRQLREQIVRIRMVPIAQLFERMRLVVRGLERELGKRADLSIEGADTEIDKVVVERMIDPLLHLVRNAVSHGIESPDERIAAGKPAAGVIRLSAKTAGDIVILRVQDDGRGIDAAEVSERARRLGWLKQDEVADAGRLLEIISTPGFTTRDAADLASGRGIGMAAVKAEIQSLGATMNLTTSQGRGTHFTIKLPVTLLITDALIVSVGGRRFAVPQAAVQEVLAVLSSEIRALENHEVIAFRGGVLPLLRLSEMFAIPSAERGRLHVLVIDHGGSPLGLVLDRVTGQNEIVVRTMTDPLLRVPGVVGATELGDGRPVLILDPHSIASAARSVKLMGTTA